MLPCLSNGEKWTIFSGATVDHGFSPLSLMSCAKRFPLHPAQHPLTTRWLLYGFRKVFTSSETNQLNAFLVPTHMKISVL